MEILRTIAGTARRRPAKLLFFVLSLGVSFGFVAAVAALGHASWSRLPPGVANQPYVTALRETATSVQSLSLRDFEEMEARVPEVSWFYVRGMNSGSLEAEGRSGATQTLNARPVSEDFFSGLGVQPELGALVPSDDGPAAIIADKLWRRLYERQDVIGMPLRMDDGLSLPIIGVASPEFVGVLESEPDAWVLNQPAAMPILPFMVGLDEQAKRQLDRLWPDVTVFGVVPHGRDVDGVVEDVRVRLAEYRFDAQPIRVERVIEPGSSGEPNPKTTPMMVAFGISDSDRVALGAGIETEPDKRREVVQRASWLLGVAGLLLLLAFVSVVEFLMAENVSREDEQKVPNRGRCGGNGPVPSRGGGKT